VVAVIISLLLFISAFEIVSEAVAGETAIIPYHGWVLAAVGALVLAPFLFGRYEIGAGRKYNSPSLVAEGKQFRADVLSASIVFFALLGQTFGLPLDRIAAGIVAGFIAYSGWGLLRNGMRVLLDASVGGETLARIRTLIESQPEVGRVLHLTGRNSGRYMFIETAVAMRVTDLRQAHQVSERLERLVKDAEPSVDRVIIHYEPQTRTVIRYAFPLVSRGEEISKHFGEAPYFAVVDVDTERRRAVRHEILANPHAALEKGKGLQVARFLLGRKVDVVVTRESLAGKGPGYAFAEAGAETRQTDAGVIDEFLRQEGIQTTP
jgi:cation diffusion facilitator family transporter